MIQKILIANRGEIACRVIKSAKLMGIKTVAVYSDADKNALHVTMADEAVYIGTSPASESYLIIDKILAACQQTNADAVHPGYGFLSENANFAKTLAKNNIAFIGPNIEAIEVMGDKIASKLFAEKANVNIVPGNTDLIESPEQAVVVSNQVGYPVMIKASAGGGGKGMRVAYDDAEATQGYTLAKSEAMSSFGDDRIFIEKFIEDPRHIEIQVLADKFGNCLYLAERECSIQRRNQKVVEEAPSSFLTEETRKKMGEQSVALAKAVNYESAGTVEFIVDKDQNFYFLEMNTRLQVEHPVTELITGIDLVEQMIKVAAGEKLALKQDDIKINGWAIESRIYAEDPFRNFLPSTGRLTKYFPPTEKIENGITIRNDTGVYHGGEIAIYYDPMIAKLCTHAPTRSEAISQMANALDQFVIKGISHNIPFVASLMQHPDWQSGDISTNFIAKEYPDGFERSPLDDKSKAEFCATAAYLSNQQNLKKSAKTANILIIKLDDEYIEVNIECAETFTVKCMRQSFTLMAEYQLGAPLWSGKINAEDRHFKVDTILNGFELEHKAFKATAKIFSTREAELDRLMPIKIAPDTSNLLLCPMPGMLNSINVKVGDKVEAGQALCVVEAMKMENVLSAEKNATVKTVNFEAGDNLKVDDIIVEFELDQ